MKPRTKAKIGRPSLYSDQMVEVICDRLMMGESLNKICKDKTMPDITTVLKWLRDKDDFFNKYARAREVQVELMAEEILEIADDGSNDLMVIGKGNESYETENKEVTNRSKLRVETRKWIMSKLAHRRWGEKIDVTSGNEKIQKIEVEIVSPKT